MKNTYAQKLRDPRWQKKRLEILERDEFKCTECGDPTSTLHVHHKIYKGNPWDVNNEDLITLCEHCHTCIERYKKEVDIRVIRSSKMMDEDKNGQVILLDEECQTMMYIFKKNIITESIHMSLDQNLELCELLMLT